MSNEFVIGELFGDAMARELQDQQAVSESFQASMADNNEKLQSMYGDIAKGFQAKVSGAKASPEEDRIQKLVEILRGSPRLIPHVEAYVTEINAKIQEAIDKILPPTQEGGDP